MLSKKSLIFSKASLAVISFYCFANALIIIGWGPRFSGLIQEAYLFFAEAVLFVDLCTWHIFIVFAVISFIIKIVLVCKDKLELKGMLSNLILHFLFSLISVAEIYWIFENSF